MALIKCSECEKEISDRAKSCPNCGCPIEEKNEVITELQKENKVKTKEKKHIFAWFICICTFCSALVNISCFEAFIFFILAGMIVCPKFIKYAKEK